MKFENYSFLKIHTKLSLEHSFYFADYVTIVQFSRSKYSLLEIWWTGALLFGILVMKVWKSWFHPLSKARAYSVFIFIYQQFEPSCLWHKIVTVTNLCGQTILVQTSQLPLFVFCLGTGKSVSEIYSLSWNFDWQIFPMAKHGEISFLAPM